MREPIKDFYRHEEKAERWLKSRPKCCLCEEHIQDNVAFYDEAIGWICDSCISDGKKYIEEEMDGHF